MWRLINRQLVSFTGGKKTKMANLGLSIIRKELYDITMLCPFAQDRPYKVFYQPAGVRIKNRHFVSLSLATKYIANLGSTTLNKQFRLINRHLVSFSELKTRNGYANLRISDPYRGKGTNKWHTHGCQLSGETFTAIVPVFNMQRYINLRNFLSPLLSICIGPNSNEMISRTGQQELPRY